MNFAAVIALGVFSLALHGQDSKPEFNGRTWKPPYTLPIPIGWTVERFPIPISFAPHIPYTGVEDLRFAPGWSKAKSDGYWSYAFLWYLEGEVTIDPKIIESNLQAYYAGLIGANSSAIPGDKLISVSTSFEKSRTQKGDLKTFVGTIRMRDYMQQQPIVLNCKVHWRSCEQKKKTFIFFELSPQRLSHSIWRSLDRLWVDFKCNTHS